MQQKEDEESQARFEEGLPLVQSLQTHQKTPGTKADQFADTTGEEVDLFTQVGRQEQVHDADMHAPQLERKSTTDIMDSLHFQPHQQIHDPILENEDQISSSQSSLEKVTGGGIAVSASTVLSQVLGDPEVLVHGQPEGLAGLAMESGDVDLAAKWKAALTGG